LTATISTSPLTGVWSSSASFIPCKAPSLSCPRLTCPFKTPCSNGTCRLIRLNAGDSPDYESLDNERLRRYIYIEDTGNQNQKKVTVEVKWTDSGGDHSSKLETILSNY